MATGNKQGGRNNKGLRFVEATIASGAALSNAIDIGTSELVALSMPDGWTTASITFAATVDDTNYLAVQDAAGNEVSVTSPAADKHIAVSFAGIKGLNKIKVRSGTVGTPVNQGAERVITLILKDE